MGGRAFMRTSCSVTATRESWGHLLEGVVCPTPEVILSESPAHLRKRFRPEFGLALIDPAL
jgi:predicted DNA-binding protein with PD1-like motif